MGKILNSKNITFDFGILRIINLTNDLWNKTIWNSFTGKFNRLKNMLNHSRFCLQKFFWNNCITQKTKLIKSIWIWSLKWFQIKKPCSFLYIVLYGRKLVIDWLSNLIFWSYPIIKWRTSCKSVNIFFWCALLMRSLIMNWSIIIWSFVCWFKIKKVRTFLDFCISKYCFKRKIFGWIFINS